MIRLEQRAMRVALWLPLGFSLSCGRPTAKFPWSPEVRPLASEHAQVRTLNPGYSRLRSRVVVREVARPTRAALDYAAYHANFMIADPTPETDRDGTTAPDHSTPYDGAADESTLTAAIGSTPL